VFEWDCAGRFGTLIFTAIAVAEPILRNWAAQAARADSVTARLSWWGFKKFVAGGPIS